MGTKQSMTAPSRTLEESGGRVCIWIWNGNRNLEDDLGSLFRGGDIIENSWDSSRCLVCRVCSLKQNDQTTSVEL